EEVRVQQPQAPGVGAGPPRARAAAAAVRARRPGAPGRGQRHQRPAGPAVHLPAGGHRGHRRGVPARAGRARALACLQVRGGVRPPPAAGVAPGGARDVPRRLRVAGAGCRDRAHGGRRRGPLGLGVHPLKGSGPDPADPETPLDRAGLRETRTLWDHASPHGLAVGSLQMWIRAVDPADDEQMKKYCLAGARPDQLWPDCAVQVDPSELRVTLREVSGLSVPSGGMDVVATVAVSAPCYTEAHHRPWSQATDVHFNLDGPLGTAEFNWRAVFDLRSSVADVVLYISLYDRRRGICIGESQLALSHAFVETTVIRDQAEDLVCAELEQLDLCAVDGKRRGHVRCSLVLLSAALAARCPAAPGREKVDVDPCLLEASIGSLKEVPAVLGEHLAQPPRGRRRLDVAASRAASLKRRPRALTGMAALLLPAIVVSALLHHRRSPPASCRAFTSPGPASLPPRRSWTTPFASLAPSLSAPAAPLRVALG
ncbi:unnamed protein product, partial [Prorocentrum cordatum]